MKYDIYFHDDFDGRASAVVILSFLRGRGDDIEHYVPLKYNILPQWLDEDFFKKHKLFKGKHNPAIVVDFLYHPQAAFWFEHHPTTFKKDSWKKNFKPDKQHHLDPRYKSACHLTYAALKSSFGWKPPKHLANLVKWLDVIDGAGYRSAKQVIEMKEPALQTSAIIEEERPLKETIWAIKFLAERSFEDFIKQPAIRKRITAARKRIKAAITFYRKNLVIEGRVGFIDLTKESFDGVRFVSYYLHPKLMYSMRVSIQHGLYHLNTGVNPWLSKKNKIHIGDVMKKYGGGGHMGVGGVELSSRKELDHAVRDIIEVLNKKK